MMAVRAAAVALVVIGALANGILVTPGLASSRYSLRGEGEPILGQSASARALGGAEVAARTPSLSGNPASLVFTDRARFFGSWETEWIRSEEPSATGKLVAKDYSGFIPNLGLVFPLRANLTMGLGLVVERRVDAQIELQRTVTGGPNYTQIFEANGNHLRIPLLLAWNHPRVQLGSGLDIQLANSRLRSRNDFEVGSNFSDSDDLEKRQLFGVAWRAGVRVPLGARAALGGWVSLPGELNGSQRFENDDNDDSDDLKIDIDSELPTRFALGLDLQPLSRLRIAVDWTHEAWEDVTPFDPTDTYVTVDRISMGAEWGKGSTASWPLRLGYRTEPLHVLDEHTAGAPEEIREHIVSAGTGFQFAGGRGMLDTYLEYGWRGVTDESEYYEQVFRFGVTLTGFESWSRRRVPEAEEDW